MSQEGAFFDQFVKNYSQLFPDKSIMLAIMHLLSRFADAEGPACEFSESQLIEVLQQAREEAPIIGNGQRAYTPREYLNHKIHSLLEHYLSRDERTGSYYFTQYAISLYHTVRNALFEKVNPIKVAGIFRTLQADLAINSLSHWASVTLPSFQNEVYQQLLAFDNDINSTLKQLRRHLNQDEQDFLVMLTQVCTTLDDLRDQAQALTDAFSIAEDIQAQISAKRLLEEETAEIDAVPQAVAFLRRARGKLGTASDRLERVRPRVNMLFSDLTKLRFDHNTERFLMHLLAAEPAGKVIALPSGIGLPEVWLPDATFLAVPRSASLFPLARVKSPLPVEDPELRAANQRTVQQKIQQTTRVQHYLRQLVQGLKTEEEIEFTPYAAQILATEGPAAHGVLMQVIDRLLRELVPRHGWQVLVTPELQLLQNETFRLTLWNIRLRRPRVH